MSADICLGTNLEFVPTSRYPLMLSKEVTLLLLLPENRRLRDATRVAAAQVHVRTLRRTTLVREGAAARTRASAAQTGLAAGRTTLTAGRSSRGALLVGWRGGGRCHGRGDGRDRTGAARVDALAPEVFVKLGRLLASRLEPAALTVEGALRGIGVVALGATKGASSEIRARDEVVETRECVGEWRLGHFVSALLALLELLLKLLELFVGDPEEFADVSPISSDRQRIARRLFVGLFTLTSLTSWTGRSAGVLLGA